MKKLSLVLLLSLSCAEPFTTSVQQIDVVRLLPPVEDARVRLSKGILDIPTRQQVTLGIAQLEFALRSQNVLESRKYEHQLEDLLGAYGAQQNRGDGADVSGIELMLQAVSLSIGVA